MMQNNIYGTTHPIEHCIYVGQMNICHSLTAMNRRQSDIEGKIKTFSLINL